MQIKEIKMTEEILSAWEKSFVPNEDIFYLAQLDEAEAYLPEGVLILPIHEFFNHSSYQQINLVNSYCYWNRSKAVRYAVVLPDGAFEHLPSESRQYLISLQKKLGRGLTWSWNEIEPFAKESYINIEEAADVFSPYMFQEGTERYGIWNSALWGKLPSEFKSSFLLKMAGEFIQTVHIPSEQWENIAVRWPQIAPYMNQFPAKNGGNCFAAVLAAATDDVSYARFLINEWIHDKTFFLGLSRRGYVALELESIDEFTQAGDVLIWENEQREIIHAAFYLGHQLVFNKNGQMFFNPWQIASLEEVNRIWGNEGKVLLRKKV